MRKGNLEIERKFLIRMPNVAQIAKMPDVEIWDIVQTYLLDGADGSTRRVRRVLSNGEVRYIHTVKHRITNITHEEHEHEISRAEYARLLREANPRLRPIEKRRYRVAYAGQLLEIDLYAFWNDRATLEIEMDSEEQALILPDWLEIVREVTDERAYKNRFLAESVPMEALA